MKFYKAFKMKTDGIAEGGFKFSLYSTECYEENGELVDVEVSYNGNGVVDETVKKDGVELEVFLTAKRCFEQAVVCGYPYFFKVEVPEGAVIEEDVEHGYTIVKEFRIIRELSFDDMMALTAREMECLSAPGEADHSDGETEGRLNDLVDIVPAPKKWEAALEAEKKNATPRRRHEQECCAKFERENERLCQKDFEHKRLLPFWLILAAILGLDFGYFLGFLIGILV